MRWSILILTQPARREKLARLLELLRPQLAGHEDVELLVKMFDPALNLGENRQRLLDLAAGDYVNFIDDDDLVVKDYVARILPLLDGVDYVGFRVAVTVNGERMPDAIHSLRYKTWSNDPDGYYRGISHLNPLRRELALRVRMEGERGEDHRWSDQLMTLGVARSERFINEVMYFYYATVPTKLWTIMILTMPERKKYLDRLLALLVPQVKRREDTVELAIRTFEPTITLGENRELMRRQAGGRYVNFIDDDDMVSDDYVETILPFLDGVDYVGFSQAMYHDGRFQYIERRSLTYKGVFNDGDVHARDISHLNPALREKALRIPMEGGPGEDSRWGDAMRTAKVLRTEHVIPRVLYFYYWRRVKEELAHA